MLPVYGASYGNDHSRYPNDMCEREVRNDPKGLNSAKVSLHS